MLIKNMVVYHFVDPGGWENLWKTGDSRKREYWFLNGRLRLRHFHKFALVIEDNLIHKLSAFCAFLEQKESHVKALYTFPKFICCHKNCRQELDCEVSQINHASIQHKGKYFEDNVKKEVFWMILIFKLRNKSLIFKSFDKDG